MFAKMGAMASKVTGGAAPEAVVGPTIKWEEKNYPPYIKLIHFDLTEVTDVEKAQALKYTQWSGWLAAVSGVINLLFMIVLTIAGVSGAGLYIALSFIQLGLIVAGGIGALHFLFPGLIKGERNVVIYGMIIQGLFCLVFLLFSLISAGQIEGVSNIASDRLTESPVPGLWTVLTIIDSVSWIANLILGAFAIVYTFLEYRKISASTANKAKDAVMVAKLMTGGVV